MNIREAVAIAIMEADHGRKGHAAITAFLDAAAEEGWHMRPDEATGDMPNCGCIAWLESKENADSSIQERCRIIYYAMCDAAPKYELEA